MKKQQIAFRAEHICLQAGDFALQDVSFSLTGNDYMILLGPTGSGKSMLLEVLAGLRRPDSGRIFLNDREITRLPPEQRGFSTGIFP